MPYQGLVAGTRPATTLSPMAYISTDFIGCTQFSFLIVEIRVTQWRCQERQTALKPYPIS